MLGKGVQRMLLLAMFMFMSSFAAESPPQGMTRADAANSQKLQEAEDDGASNQEEADQKLFVEEEELLSHLNGSSAAQQSIIKGWRSFDDDKDGKISPVEFKKIDKKLGEVGGLKDAEEGQEDNKDADGEEGKKQ